MKHFFISGLVYVKTPLSELMIPTSMFTIFKDRPTYEDVKQHLINYNADTNEVFTEGNLTENDVTNCVVMAIQPVSEELLKQLFPDVADELENKE